MLKIEPTGVSYRHEHCSMETVSKQALGGPFKAKAHLARALGHLHFGAIAKVACCFFFLHHGALRHQDLNKTRHKGESLQSRPSYLGKNKSFYLFFQKYGSFLHDGNWSQNGTIFRGFFTAIKGEFLQSRPSCLGEKILLNPSSH